MSALDLWTSCLAPPAQRHGRSSARPRQWCRGGAAVIAEHTVEANSDRVAAVKSRPWSTADPASAGGSRHRRRSWWLTWMTTGSRWPSGRWRWFSAR